MWFNLVSFRYWVSLKITLWVHGMEYLDHCHLFLFLFYLFNLWKRFVLSTRVVWCVKLHYTSWEDFGKRYDVNLKQLFPMSSKCLKLASMWRRASLMLSKLWLVHCGFHSHIPMSFSCIYACSWASFYSNWIINLLVETLTCLGIAIGWCSFRCMDIFNYNKFVPLHQILMNCIWNTPHPPLLPQTNHNIRNSPIYETLIKTYYVIVSISSVHCWVL